MGSFVDIGLTYIFSIALAGLIALTFVAAFMRLFLNNRKLAKNQKKQDLEVAEKATQKSVMQETLLDEGDYFGIRAIERGYYGGVAQSPLASAQNSPQPSPTPTIRDGNGPPISLTFGEGMNTPEPLSAGPSISLSPANAQPMKMPRSPIALRLQPSNAELTGRRNHDSIGLPSTYVPKLYSKPESSADIRQISEDVSKASSRPNTRPVLEHRVQSYAQWRLAADMKRSPRKAPRCEVKPPSLASQDGFRNTLLMLPPVNRHRSRSASKVDKLSQRKSLQQEMDDRKSTSSADIIVQPIPIAYRGSPGELKQSTKQCTPSSSINDQRNHSSTRATRASKSAQSTSRQTNKLAVKSMAQERGSSRRNSAAHHGSNKHHRNDSGCELEIPPNVPTAGGNYSGRAGSSSSSKSSSSTQSPRSSHDSSTSSFKSTIESQKDKSEPDHPLGLATITT